MTPTALLTEKVTEVRQEMLRAGIWKNESPAWVNDFTERGIGTGEDFCGWLQFVYLPNRLQEAASKKSIPGRTGIVPQAVKYFGSDINKGKLLQLLIELDSL